MRIELKRDKQKELIFLSKVGKTWKQLSEELDINEHYLATELYNGKRLLSERIFLKLSKIAREDFSKHIKKKFKNNWGKTLGGKKSEGNTKEFLKPPNSKKLAELFGIILGDGHIENYKQGKKIRNYSVTITGHEEDDKEYMTKYVPSLIYKLLKERVYFGNPKSNKAIFVRVYGKRIVNFLKEKELSSGNKKTNNQGIPRWIKKDKELLRYCIKGLIDTDGSVHKISKDRKDLRICFTSYIPNLLREVKNSLEILGVSSSKIIKGNQIFVTKKSDVERYFKEIGFSNKKHLNRIQNLRKQALVV